MMDPKGITRLQLIFLRCYSNQLQVAPSVPVLRIPAYIKKHLAVVEKREKEKLINLRKRISYRGDTSFPVISSTKKQFNFYLGQIYNQNYPIPLQSKEWLKMTSAGQKFTINPWDTNPSLPVLYNRHHEKETGFPRTFPELLSDENLLQQLQNRGYKCPTPIQVLSIPSIFKRKHLVLAAETGCGKTVGYLAPIIQNITAVKKRTKLFPDTPLALILTPGRELAEQIGVVAYDLCRNTDLKVNVLVSDGSKHQHLRLKENSDVDILVASMGTLAKLVVKGIFKVTNLRHLVLDEADTLLDDSFIESTEWLFRRIPLFINSAETLPPEDGTQLIFVSSTYPLNADELLGDLCQEDDVIKIRTPYLHKVMCHVKQKFWRVDKENKCGILLDMVKSDYEKKVPVMIFSTHSNTCDWMSLFLEENGVPNVKYHGGLSPTKRAKVLELFTEGAYDVMCCTDLASRGLDTQHVKHVINFDFPSSVSDYILRAGRVGRVGTNHGYVTNLVGSKCGVFALQEIEKAVRSTSKISNVDANIKQKIENLYFDFHS